ncbi:hypothetical protein BDV38DRAFT_284889 [Aspergillus pseudotamarii]|uniref:Uncharacterized protein n=1 Tax=Aspergillus pseudotamarii TaxID=132259 RepID=A0A5N6SP08_ASPPS|nr:uncharacterized protein BDV38DRAFT_284889 [Aspergillus pseudotamarii]KAE8135451.1 hypothetical protein BDV38DRAFT_284889 [Aspergillus pseudotamarii]
MKIQALCSLAVVGLAFANPIHNLAERGIAFTECITGVVEKAVSQACTTVPEACGGLDAFTSCTTTATAKITDIKDHSQRRLEWLDSVNTCGQDLWEVLKAAGVTDVDLNKLQVSFLEIATEGVSRCSTKA